MVMEYRNYNEKVAVVTGGAAGIGRAIADLWCAGGGRVVLTDIDQQAAENAAEQLNQAGGKAIALQMDVNDLDAVKTLVPLVKQHFNGIDALFNVAGNNSMKTVEEAEDAEWRFIIDVNLMSVYRVSKVVIPELRQRGGGSIINVASIAGVLAENRCSAYSAAKGAVITLTKNGLAISSGSAMRPREQRSVITFSCPGLACI